MFEDPHYFQILKGVFKNADSAISMFSLSNSLSKMLTRPQPQFLKFQFKGILSLRASLGGGGQGGKSKIQISL